MRKLTCNQIAQIQAWAKRGLPQPEIAKLVGVGLGSVNKYAKAPTRSVTKPEPPPPPRDTRKALDDAIWEAETPLAFAEACLARDRHDDPELDELLSRPDWSLVDALIQCGDRLLLLCRPEDFAELAESVSGSPDSCFREDFTSDEEHAAALALRKADEQRHAIDLLTRALDIVRAAH